MCGPGVLTEVRELIAWRCWSSWLVIHFFHNHQENALGETKADRQFGPVDIILEPQGGVMTFSRIMSLLNITF